MFDKLYLNVHSSDLYSISRTNSLLGVQHDLLGGQSSLFGVPQRNNPPC